jgi:peptide/nickel transport system permease protein
LLRYIIRRLLWVVVLLFAVSFITFVIFYLLPTADPAALRAGRQPNPELVEQIRHSLGLDNPWYQQYYDYMKQLVLHFDFGYSYQNNISVKQQIFDRLPATASLAIGAAVIWLLSGIAVGIVSAIRRRSALDRFTMGGALVAISAPVYWLGLVALYLFSSDIGKFPIPFFRERAAMSRSQRIPRSGSSRCCCRGSSWRPRSRPSTRGCFAPTSSKPCPRTTSGRPGQRDCRSEPWS